MHLMGNAIGLTLKRIILLVIYHYLMQTRSLLIIYNYMIKSYYYIIHITIYNNTNSGVIIINLFNTILIIKSVIKENKKPRNISISFLYSIFLVKKKA